MVVYLLCIDSPTLLNRAFDRVLASSRVASCMIEPELGRLRFLAPSACAERLVERIYAEGGLRWCSRHAVTSGAEELTGPLPRLRLVDAPSELQL